MVLGARVRSHQDLPSGRVHTRSLFPALWRSCLRRQACWDVDPNKAIIADTMKLVGNSSYGKTITDQERHREVKFCEETKASRLINTPFFRQIDRIEENTYEANWFPRTDTPEHKAYDKRTPGLFKEEWSGAGIIGLSSKTYYCFGAYDKFSCKGVNKKTNDINKEKYLNVLLTKQSSSGLNKGFRVVNNSMYTYEQVRDGFSYFYPKRKVLEDRVTTMPLDI
ncbi:unnamed protein product [Porites lobata]|uniref:Uncharacterized protein n=1 Tax=Porites lobata TaxID=104759 RepID=A0ABN8NEJ4_9CNID|nr:unnamed protein product [Porites lobata]